MKLEQKITFVDYDRIDYYKKYPLIYSDTLCCVGCKLYRSILTISLILPILFKTGEGK
ncbi:MAG: hypothetical protein H7A25_05210 [Leptospiraceae bacterium]|nr:hypothetical protein [Leptospiraceae bacterium]